MSPSLKKPKLKSIAERLEPARLIVERKATVEGVTQTTIPFLSIMRFSQPLPLNRGMLKPSFCLLLQGKKHIHLGNEIVEYGVGEYLAAMIDMPAAGQVVGASKAKPYLGVRVEMDPKEIAQIIIDGKIDVSMKKRGPGAFVGQSNEEIIDAICKLVKLLDNPEDAAFLAESIKREIVYRLLKSKCGPYFYEFAVFEESEQGIGKTLNWLKANFARHFKIEELAKMANMSVSSFHHKFKSSTTMGPLQYQKQLRLQEARRLLLAGMTDASNAAYRVGYESISQFTREYRRLFGAPPMQDVKALRLKPVTQLQD